MRQANVYIVIVALVAIVAIVIFVLNVQNTGKALLLPKSSYTTSSCICPSPQICGINDLGNTVCLLPGTDPEGSRCLSNLECSSGLCGLSNQGIRICETAGSNARGDSCISNSECASNNCVNSVCQLPQFQIAVTNPPPGGG